MAQGNRRRWERFAYPGELRLRSAEGTMAAKLVDLSRGGMQLALTATVDVGDTLSTELTTAHGTLGLQGRVRWTGSTSAGAPKSDLPADQPQGRRVGVAFDALEGCAQRRLEALERELAGESVLVQLADGSTPLRAVATQSLAGLRLDVALPALSTGAVLNVRPLRARAQSQPARVVSAQLQAAEAGQPPRVELLVEPGAGARKRRYLHYEHTTPAARPTPARSDSASGGPLTIPKTRTNMLLTLSLPALALLWLAARLLGLPPATQHAIMQAGSPAPPRHAAAARRPPARALASRDGAARAEPEPRATTAVQAASDPAPPEPALVAPAPAAKHDSTSAEAAQARGNFAISSTQDTSELFVPVTGSLSGLATKLWIDPPAVVVDMPGADVALNEAHYDVEADGIVGISVGKPGGVTQLRVYVNSILSQYEASASPGGVTIRIKRDLQSLRF